MMLLDRFVAASVPRLPRGLVRRVASRYISGEDVESALRATAELNARGITTTVDLLGENITRLDEARATVDVYVEILRGLDERGLRGNVSVKPTHLGLQLDPDVCRENVRVIAEAAAARNRFVRIDMEDSSTTDATLGMYRTLRESRDNVGVVLQSRLRRTRADAEALAAIGARVRVCKGIYLEKPAVAYQEGEEINRSFLDVVRTLLEAGCHVAIATHDRALVDGSLAILAELEPPEGSYEFQMLYGVTEGLRDSLVSRGHPLRVYVPFGVEWYAYSVRRLRENPRIAGHVLRAMVGLSG